MDKNIPGLAQISNATSRTARFPASVPVKVIFTNFTSVKPFGNAPVNKMSPPVFPGLKVYIREIIHFVGCGFIHIYTILQTNIHYLCNKQNVEY